MNHDIFISYSSKQKSIADGVCHYLEENGFKCWMAPRDIPVGSEYGDLIEEAIKTSKVVVLVFSQAASISKWVKGEINVAFTEDKPILPFRIDETEIKGGFRVMLNQMHWIDAFPHYADRLPDLLSSVCGFLGRQPQKVSDDNVRFEREAGRKVKKDDQSMSDSGTANGHEYVDLGLPSGTLWATCNVGANKPEDYGNYFSWDEGTTAAAKWGKGWSVPTKEQWEELIKCTESIWTANGGEKGLLIMASNNQSLFLPANGGYLESSLINLGDDGYYWSSSPLAGSLNTMAWCFYFNSDNFSVYPNNAYRGLSVRLVCPRIY